jgi:hypothetical protein
MILIEEKREREREKFFKLSKQIDIENFCFSPPFRLKKGILEKIKF